MMTILEWGLPLIVRISRRQIAKLFVRPRQDPPGRHVGEVALE